MNYFEFGSLWVILSLFALIVYNLGDKEKGDKSWSSYSVFNKGFRNILGALTADQFDREIRHNHTHGDNIPAAAEDDVDSEDGEEAVVDKRHLRRGKKARRGYEDKLMRRHQQQQEELLRMMDE
jgi:DNA-binding transcriptional regulator GbsR (MarR family)